MRQALYYKQHGDKVVCGLCPRECSIGEGQAGFCRVRQNKNNILYTMNYARCAAIALDPIEKKPLYHFYPGSLILSLGTWGCNFTCQFCQNWHLAQAQPETTELLPSQAVKEALKLKESGNIGLAYTYSEPSVWYEYIFDTAALAKAAGLKNVLVTNGYINEEPLYKLLPYIDAMNIDVKAFQNDFYREYCAGQLSAVKRTVELAARHCHVEITTLIIPGLNETSAEIGQLAKWLASIDPAMPLHLSRYFPQYKMNIPATSKETLIRAQEAAQKYLKYVYLGNV
ncbi:MAG: AmmeMemoRadiSam system radical SAM enzyme [Pelosinus sp.]|nr:AmmeMemoRadiSam system radical SAM enzyme [Pelosinus sp.]